MENQAGDPQKKFETVWAEKWQTSKNYLKA